MSPRSAVVLISGGLDSAVAAYQARYDIGKKGRLYGLTLDYGQRHSKEIHFAKVLCESLEVVEHRIPAPIYMQDFSESALLESSEDIIRSTGIDDGIPSTWVPQRNSIFLGMAFAYAEIMDVDFIYTGYNVVDYSGYPDCRPEFVRAMERALNLASKRFVTEGRGFSIQTPLIQLSKADIVALGLKLSVPFENTWSCYKGLEKACGVCDSCRIRLAAFESVGIQDPLDYAEIGRN